MGRTVIWAGTFCGARERKDEIVGTIAEPPKGPLWRAVLRTLWERRRGSCELLRIRKEEVHGTVKVRIGPPR
jgi:hypothetical protein